VRQGESATWGQTGSQLFESLASKYGLESLAQSYTTTHPIPWREVVILFDPAGADAVVRKCTGASFLHLYHETLRRSEVPFDLRPPEGSYLDTLLTRHGISMGTDRRMDFDDVKKGFAWTATW